MKAADRREKIKTLLFSASTPISATVLAENLEVSRQIIVGDIALLRAEGMEINATARGYILTDKTHAFPYIGNIVCKHKADDLLEELYTIVDFGGTCIDVSIDHTIYGELSGKLDISSRYEADNFVAKLSNADQPLSLLSGGIHSHHIGCPSKEIFDLISKSLAEKKILISG